MACLLCGGMCRVTTVGTGRKNNSDGCEECYNTRNIDFVVFIRGGVFVRFYNGFFY